MGMAYSLETVAGEGITVMPNTKPWCDSSLDLKLAELLSAVPNTSFIVGLLTCDRLWAVCCAKHKASRGVV